MFAYLSYFIGPVGKGAFIFLFTFPITILLAYIFLKKKNITIFRKILVYLSVLFFFLALGLVLFPFPDFVPGFCEARSGVQIWQLTPFQFIEDIQTFAQKYNVGLLRNKALFQVIFNIFLILPIGFFTAILFRLNFLKVFLLSFGVSLFFEMIQATGIFGILPCPYRLFDVDDLMLNTFGALIGFVCALPFKKKIFSIIADKNFIIREDTLLIRRVFALGFDFVIMRILFISIVLLVEKIFPISFPSHGHFVFFCELFLYFVLFAYFMKGQTFGKKIFSLKIVSVNGKNPNILQLFLRSIIPVFSFMIFGLINDFVKNTTGIILTQDGIYSLLFFSYILIFIPLSVEISTDGRGFHDKMGGTRVIKIEKQKSLN